MAIQQLDYFYDGQIRRFLSQIVRAFSGFQYEVIVNQVRQLKTVPCITAMQNKQVAQILQNNSENTALSAPLITVYIKDVAHDQSRVQAPSHISTLQVHERRFDHANNEYTGEQGNSYTVERLMPSPLNITIGVDIWTTNEFQKHQLFEQIYMAFNVGFDIQNSDNALDWSALTTMMLDNMVWSSNSIPIGTSDAMDIMSFTFRLPMWISPPAKVTQQRVIEQIVANIHSGETAVRGLTDDAYYGDISDTYDNLLSQDIITPENYRISILGNEITLLDEHGGILDVNGNPYDWQTLLWNYGQLVPASSQLRLRANIEQAEELDIIGTIQIDSSRPNVLLWQVYLDTLPGNTIDPINGVIDPMLVFPDHGLPTPQEGDRYMILQDIGPSLAWGNITAHEKDIIQYRNNVWVKDFDSSAKTGVDFALNSRTGKQLKHVNHEWIFAIDGEYFPGYWRIKL